MADDMIRADQYFTIRDGLGAEMRLSVVRDIEEMQDSIEFLANSWWRRTLIKLISGGRLEFYRG